MKILNFFKKRRRAIEIEWEEKKRQMNAAQYRQWLETREGLSMFCELVKYDRSKCSEQLRKLNAMSATPKPTLTAECKTCGIVPVDKPTSRKLLVCPYCDLSKAIKQGYTPQIAIH